MNESAILYCMYTASKVLLKITSKCADSWNYVNFKLLTLKWKSFRNESALSFLLVVYFLFVLFFFHKNASGKLSPYWPVWNIVIFNKINVFCIWNLYFINFITYNFILMLIWRVFANNSSFWNRSGNEGHTARIRSLSTTPYAKCSFVWVRD